MARRELQEINAGSMADIAFLLLIFWLVTTTIDSDIGLRRKLPAWEEPGNEVVMEIDEQNTFKIIINRNNELFVEGEEYESVDAADIRKRVKDFLIGAGDGLASHKVGTKTVGETRPFVKGANGSPYPDRMWVDQVKEEKLKERFEVQVDSLENEKKLFEKALDGPDVSGSGLYEIDGKSYSTEDIERVLERNENNLKEVKSARERSKLKLEAVEAFGGKYRLLDEGAVVAVQVDKATSYEVYIQTQDEVMSAISELRNELAMSQFNISFQELEAIYEDNKDDLQTLQKINSCKVVYPERLTELSMLDTEFDNQESE